MPPLYFPKLIQINYDLMLRRKWLWFVPNLMQILSIFLKWHAIKQSGLTFLAYRVSIINSDKLSHSYDDLYLGVTFLGQKVCGLLACAIARYVVYVCQSELQHLAMLCQPRDILYDVSSTGTMKREGQTHREWCRQWMQSITNTVPKSNRPHSKILFNTAKRFKL